MKKWLILGLIGLNSPIQASEMTDSCVLEQMKTTELTKSYAQWTELCSLQQDHPTEVTADVAFDPQLTAEDESEPLWDVIAIDPVAPEKLGSASKRIRQESESSDNPFSITTHRRNYLLPVYTTDGINHDAYSEVSDISDSFEEIESKFQLSFKIPLNSNDLFVEYDHLYFGFTLEAWWQIYATGISRPFRETNYRPEFFYLMPTNWHPFEGNVGLTFGIEHQSNGQFTQLSRSWNRLYTGVIYEKGSFVAALQPWYRLPEEQSDDPEDDTDDDNPDIEDYMGHFTLTMGYAFNDREISFQGRQNFETGFGAGELSYSFPLWGKLRGYTTLFHGYGDSMIDYNHSQTRFGLGVSFNRLF